MICNDIFIYPTDTVWGIGASIYSQVGQEQIAAIKKTSADKPLSIMFPSVDMILESFLLPLDLSQEWLTQFFSLETTLAVDLKLSKIAIPKWITHNETMVAFRCVSNEAIKNAIEKAKAPITTTSLNLTSEPPIFEIAKARKFHQRFASDAYLFEDQNQILSGHSSTFVKLLPSDEFIITRKGFACEQVEKYLGL